MPVNSEIDYSDLLTFTQTVVKLAMYLLIFWVTRVKLMQLLQVLQPWPQAVIIGRCIYTINRPLSSDQVLSLMSGHTELEGTKS